MGMGGRRETKVVFGLGESISLLASKFQRMWCLAIQILETRLQGCEKWLSTRVRKMSNTNTGNTVAKIPNTDQKIKKIKIYSGYVTDTIQNHNSITTLSLVHHLLLLFLYSFFFFWLGGVGWFFLKISLHFEN